MTPRRVQGIVNVCLALGLIIGGFTNVHQDDQITQLEHRIEILEAGR